MIVQLYALDNVEDCWPMLVDFHCLDPDPILRGWCLADQIRMESGEVPEGACASFNAWLESEGCTIIASQTRYVSEFYGPPDFEPSVSELEDTATGYEEATSVLKQLFAKGNLLVDLNVSRWSGQQALTEEDLRKAGVLKEAPPRTLGDGELPLVGEARSPGDSVPEDLVRLGWTRLIPKEERAQLSLSPSRARAFLNSWALPFPVSGVRFIPERSVDLVLAALEQFKVQDQAAVDLFLSRYDQIRTATLEKYPEFAASLEGAYPPIADVRAKFAFKYRCFVVDDTGVAGEAGLNNDTDAWFVDLVGLLRNEVLTVVRRVTEKLTKGDTIGKATLEALARVFEQFLRRDLCQDDTVREAIERASIRLTNIDPDAYKPNQIEARMSLFEDLDAIVQASRNPTQLVVESFKRRLMV